MELLIIQVEAEQIILIFLVGAKIRMSPSITLHQVGSASIHTDQDIQSFKETKMRS